MLYWNLDWNTNQDRGDPIYTQNFLLINSKQFFLSQNSSKQF